MYCIFLSFFLSFFFVGFHFMCVFTCMCMRARARVCVCVCVCVRTSSFIIGIFHFHPAMCLNCVPVGTAFLWWTYAGLKQKLDDETKLKIPLLAVDISSESAFLTFAIVATVLTVHRHNTFLHNTSSQHLLTTPPHNTSSQHLLTTPHNTSQHHLTTPHNTTSQHLTTPPHNTSSHRLQILTLETCKQWGVVLL